MATATDILAIAVDERGYTEWPAGSNRTKYGAWYGMNGVPWCAIFVSWVFAQAGAIALLGGKRAYTPTFARYFIDRGAWGSTPKLGAVVFFDFPDNVDRIQHVGLVVSFTEHWVTTIEGNTSSTDAGSQSNGGGVFLRLRRRNASIVGYGYPDYGPEEVASVDDEGYIIAGGHTRGPEHPDFKQRDAEFIEAIQKVCRDFGKAPMRVSVPKYAYKDGPL